MNLRRTRVNAPTAHVEARTTSGMIAQLQTGPPGLRSETRPLQDCFPLRELESGGLGMALAEYAQGSPRGLSRRSIFKARFVCMGAADSP